MLSFQAWGSYWQWPGGLPNQFIGPQSFLDMEKKKFIPGPKQSSLAIGKLRQDSDKQTILVRYLRVQP